MEADSKTLVDLIKYEKDLLDRRLSRSFVYQASIFAAISYVSGGGSFLGVESSSQYAPLCLIVAVMLSLQSAGVIAFSLFSQRRYWLAIEESHKETFEVMRPNKKLSAWADNSIVLVPIMLVCLWLWVCYAHFFLS